MAEEQQDGQKTLVSFVVGLLIGGMLVWAFSSPTADAPAMQSEAETEEITDTNEEVVDDKKAVDNSAAIIEAIAPAAELTVGEGKVSVKDQAVSQSVALDSAVYPVSEGWIGVREYNNEQLGYILGVARFSESQGLVPDEIALLRATTAGKQYAIVIYTEDGDREFSLANDVQIDTIFDTFTAK